MSKSWSFFSINIEIERGVTPFIALMVGILCFLILNVLAAGSIELLLYDRIKSPFVEFLRFFIFVNSPAKLTLSLTAGASDGM